MSGKSSRRVFGALEPIGQLGGAEPDALATAWVGAVDELVALVAPAGPSRAGAPTGPASTDRAANTPANPVATAAATCAREGMGTDVLAGIRRRIMSMCLAREDPDRA